MSAQRNAEVCRRKVGYRSMRKALNERDRLLAVHGAWTQCFRCAHCHLIHLGTPYSQQRRARRSA